MTPKQLIDLFQKALSEAWGYIWGAAGILWTDARQKQKVSYMASKYGSGWKTSPEAKKDNYYGAAMYGSKWIGKYVADCSGLFVWAYRQLGAAIAHGSNSIWRSHCSARGNLNAGKRTDGKGLKPGTAVFTDHDGDKTHIGLYVGDGLVIEASGTIAGVITSKVSASKWKCWGELKAVNYDGTDPDPGTALEPAATPAKPSRPTLKKGSKGSDVKALQKQLQSLGYDLGPCGVDGDFGSATDAAVRAFQLDAGLSTDGIVGTKTWAALDRAAAQADSPHETALYTVHIPFLPEPQADGLIRTYPGSWKTAEAS